MSIAWKELKPTGAAAPGARSGHTLTAMPAAVDGAGRSSSSSSSSSSRFLLFGGHGRGEDGKPNAFGDLYELEMVGGGASAAATARWTRLHAGSSSSSSDGGGATPSAHPVSPPPRAKHCAVALDARRLLVFGGLDRRARCADMWMWDGQAWREVTPTVRGPASASASSSAATLAPPAPRAHATATLVRPGLILVFGGYGGAGSVYGDLWALRYSSNSSSSSNNDQLAFEWQDLSLSARGALAEAAAAAAFTSSSQGPSPRFDHAAVAVRVPKVVKTPTNASSGGDDISSSSASVPAAAPDADADSDNNNDNDDAPNRLLILGGRDFSRMHADVAALDLETLTWCDPAESCAPLVLPPDDGEESSGAAVDGSGSGDGQAAASGVCSLLATAVPSVPHHRLFTLSGRRGVMRYCGRGLSVLTLGGDGDGGEASVSAWRLPPSSSAAAAAPCPREDAAWAFDSRNSSFVLFGGWADRWLGDLRTCDASAIVGPPYAVTAVEPAHGPVFGGTEVVVRGLRFRGDGGAAAAAVEQQDATTPGDDEAAAADKSAQTPRRRECKAASRGRVRVMFEAVVAPSSSSSGPPSVVVDGELVEGSAAVRCRAPSFAAFGAGAARVRVACPAAGGTWTVGDAGAAFAYHADTAARHCLAFGPAVSGGSGGSNNPALELPPLPSVEPVAAAAGGGGGAAPDPASSSSSSSSEPVVARFPAGNGSARLFIQARDTANARRTTGGDRFLASLEPVSAASAAANKKSAAAAAAPAASALPGAPVPVADDGGGLYSATVSAPFPGLFWLHVCHHDLGAPAPAHVRGSPFLVEAVAAPEAAEAVAAAAASSPDEAAAEQEQQQQQLVEMQRVVVDAAALVDGVELWTRSVTAAVALGSSITATAAAAGQQKQSPSPAATTTTTTTPEDVIKALSGFKLLRTGRPGVELVMDQVRAALRLVAAEAAAAAPAAAATIATTTTPLSLQQQQKLAQEQALAQQKRLASLQQQAALVAKLERRLDDSAARLQAARRSAAPARAALDRGAASAAERAHRDIEALSSRARDFCGGLPSRALFTRATGAVEAYAEMDTCLSELALLRRECARLEALAGVLFSDGGAGGGGAGASTSSASAATAAQLSEASRALSGAANDLSAAKETWDLAVAADAAMARWKASPWSVEAAKARAEAEGGDGNEPPPLLPPWQPEQVEDGAKALLRDVRALPRRARCDWDLGRRLEQDVRELVASLPLAAELRAPAVRARHWKQLAEAVAAAGGGGGADAAVPPALDPSRPGGFTLGDLLAAGLHRFEEEVAEVVDCAAKEDKTEAALARVADTWSRVRLSFSPVATHEAAAAGAAATAESQQPPLCTVKMEEEDAEALEEQLVLVQGLAQGRYAATFADEIARWQRALALVADGVALLAAVQKAWVQLEALFVGSEEMRRELPDAARRFASVDALVRRVLRGFASSPGPGNAVACCTRESLSADLAEAQAGLDACGKALSEFVEAKRRAFPRFFFVSGSDLLELLATGDDPRRVVPHLPKIFQAIGALRLEEGKEGGAGGGKAAAAGKAGEKSSGGRPRALGIVSCVGDEYVPFASPMQLEGRVESYLSDVVGRMRSEVRRVIGEAVAAYPPCPEEEDEEGERGESEGGAGSGEGGGKASKKMAAFFAARERWLLSQPGQAGLLASQVHWTAEVERAFDAASRGGKRGAMRAQHRRQAAALAALVEATRRPLSPADRQRVMNQITMDAHARDVVEGLASTPEGQGIILAGGGAGGGVGGSGSSGKKNNAAAAPGAAAASCFAWSCQLRAYWDPTLRDARVRICDASFDYGHEYLGSGPRLVITPLTDRVYVTATSAAWLCLGTAPAGPAGTGKTETTKDLAAALGRPIYVFNCSPEMDYRAMGDIFKGLASSGGWGCFDEFNRLVPEVLSVCSVQFKAVIDAQRKKAALPGRGLAHVDRATGRLVPALPASDFSFVAADGTTMPLEEGCAVFITMNPGYIGRAELPESLKALFRPITVVAPDRQLIMENMLMAEGFVTAKALAGKFAALYASAEEVMAQEKQYDWGLRSIKSVLVVAGQLLRAEVAATSSVTPERLEADVLFRALRDFNVPKILARDLPVFLALLSDLFPGDAPERRRDARFERCIAEAAREMGLVPDDEFVLRVVQLSELLAIRHCVFLMGPTGCGRTEARAVLARALQRGVPLAAGDPPLANDYLRPNNGKRVTVRELDPKAVSTMELYGYVNMSTREWRDGVLSSAMREMASSSPDAGPQWLVLDGDLDANWIESMNSVMDDNRLLTLPSNERIRVLPHMKLVFEIRDLKYATPATATRAGILYVSEAPGSGRGGGGGSSGSGNATTATTTGGWQWRAYVGAWLQRAARPYAEAARWRDKDSGVLAWLQALFDAYVPALLAACSSGGPGFSPATPLAPINQVASLCSLLEALLRPESVPGNRPESKPLIEALFVFSAVWAFGGPLVERDGVDHRRAFDRWWRGAFGAGGVLGVLSGDGGGGAGGNNNNPDAAAAIAAASAALRFPPATKGTVFDYYVCLPAKAGAGGAAGLARFAPWADTLPADDLSGSAAPGGVTSSPPPALLAASSAASGTDDLFVPTPETAALRFVLDAVAVGLRRHAMLVGGAGVGKTRLVRALLADLDARPDSDDGGREFAPSVTLPLNYYTDVASFQRAIEAPLEKKVGAAYGPPAGTRRLVYFVDDLNMPRLDSYGTAMPLSLARQVFSTGRWYDRQKLTPRSVSGVQALAAMNPAAGAFAVNPRLQRLFFAVGVAPPGREALMRIFGAVLGAHLSNPALCGGQGAPEDVQSLGARLLQASLALHERVQASFRKTAVNFHYEFSVRHLAELVKGLTRASSAGALATPARAARLWAHETMRVYSDRLSSAADVEAFGALLAPLAKKMLPLPDADEYCLPFGGGGAGASAASAGVVPREPKRPLLFCNFAGAGGGKGGNSNGGALPYEEAGEGGLAAASRALAEALAEYNGGGGGGGGNGAMDLVLFDDAVRHVARIARAISLPGGHALLVGVGGSGKQSLARLAAHVCGYVTVSPTPCSSGGGGGSASSSSSAAVAQFRDDLARALRRAGVRGEGVAFLLPDGAVSDERALVPVSDMMAGGAPPADIFSPEDRDEICAALRAEAKSLGLQDTPDSCWRLFARNVKSNLHFVVTASPVGEALRARAQRFPAMVAAAAAVDWFHPWPEASLRAVSRRFLDGVEFSAVADGGGGEGGQMQQQAASGTAESSSSDAVLITVPPAARRDAVVEFLPFVFASVGRAGAQLWAREKRRAHTTPKSHLECTRLLRSLLARRRRAAAEALGRLDAGLDKLRRTQAEADVLVAEAREVAATVERKVASANAFAAEAAAEKEKASAEGAAAALEAERCAAIAAEVSDKQAACERDLAAAEPLVAQAEAALNTLNKKDLGELKSLKTPPAGVDDVTAAVVVLLDAAPKDRGWPAAQKAMANVDKFLERLRSFKAAVDQSKLARKTVDAVRPYLELPHFSGSAIAAKSKAAAGLCEWALNIVRYYDVVSEVEPKRQELAAANARLAEAGEQLAAVQARKRELDARVAELEARAKVAIDDRDAALAEQKRCALKLELAGRLIAALASEGERWTREAAELRAGGRFLVGDTLMAAAFVSYAGPFPAAYRASLVSEWHAFLLAKGAACPVSDRARDPVALLADEAAVAGWLRQGLPSDPSSVQNGAIVGNTERWPLLIDPQLQGLMWLRQREAAAAAASGGGGGAGASPSAAIPGGGISARVGADGYLATVERALERGLPLLIEGVGEGPLDPALADVVRRAYTRRGRATYVKLAGKDVEVAPGFRLVLHTKLSSPDLPPEVHAECAVVNFAVTEQGLQEQILALVVARERPDLERAKQGLLAQSAEFTIRLKALEDGLLAQLSAAEGDVTADVALITSLEQSKAAAAEVAAKQRAALATQLAIDASREAYRPVAARGALLFFVLNGLGRVHAFYRWSLAAFLAVFARGLDSAPGGGGGGPAAAGGGKAKKAGVPPPTPLADCAVVAEAPTPKQQQLAPLQFAPVAAAEKEEGAAAAPASAAPDADQDPLRQQQLPSSPTAMLAGRSRRRATGEDIVSALARRLTGELRPFESVMELAGRVTADDAAAAAAAAAAGKQPAEAVCEEEEEVVEEKQEQKQAQAGQAEAAAKAPPSSTEPAQKQEQGSSGATLEEEEEPAPPPPLTDAALQARLSGLLESTTLAVHGYVRRGLFERDKLPALALLTFAVLCREGRLAGADAELELLLRGSVAAASSASAGAAGRGGAGAASAGMPAEEEQEDDDYDDEDEDEDEEEDGEGEGGNGSSSAQLGAAAALATALPGAFGGLPAEIERAPDAWRAWCRSPAAELSPVPQSAWAARLGIAGLTAAASAATAAPTTATTTTKQPPPPSLHSLLRHLLLIKALRPDRVTEAIARFCDRAMGPAYGGGTAAAAAAGPSPPSGDAASSSSLDDVVRDDASAAAPVFFVLFPGYSPAREVEALAARMGRTAANGHFAAVSMGQGQEPVAEQALRKAMRTGGWVFLDNLHLMQAWLPRLERLLEEGPGGGGGGGGSAAAANASASSSSSSSAQVHPGFRCLFSAKPIAGAPHAPILPEALVQSAVKVANEPPSDLRSNLRRAVASLDVAAAERRLSACHPAAPAAYRALAFGLCFFHGVLLGRKKFGVGIGGPGGGSGLGFCRAYAFNAGDLQSCADALVNSLAAAGDRAMAAAAAAAAGGGGNTTTTAPPLSIGWEDLRYSFGEIFYGGHVVDGMDRRTLSTYLRVLFREETLLPTGGPLDAADPASVWRPPAEELAPGLRAPIPLDAQAMARHVEERLPAESPAMYGLHPNAELSLLTALGEDLFRSLGDALGSVVAVSAGGGGGGGGGGAGGAAAAAAAAAPSSSSSSSSSDAAARRTLADLLARLPQELPLPDLEARAAAAGRSDAPLVVALLQETGRLNALLREMRRSMEELQLGLDGALNVTEAMDALQRALATGAVPALWMSAMSTRVQEVLGFAAWYSDVARRHDQLSRWASGAGPGACWGPGEDGDNRMEEQGAEEDGDGAAAAAAACRDPVVDAWARGLRCTWLGGLFNPKAFLAAVVQRRARALRVPLDEMAYVTEVMAPVAVGEAAAAPVAVAAPTTPADGAPVAAPAADTPATTTTAATPSLLPPPRDGGAYIVGLVLEAAGWHPGRGGSGDGSATTHGCLCDSKPGRMRAPLPPVLVRPVLAAEAARRASDPRCYLCPVYANGQRANVYSPAVATFTLPAAPDRREGRQQQQDQAGGRARAAPRDRWVLAGAALLLQDEGQQQQQQQQQQE